jgi:hypothetical protein
MLVAPTTFTTFSRNETLSLLGQISQDLRRVLNTYNRSQRNLNLKIPTATPTAILVISRLAVLGDQFTLSIKIDQRVDLSRRDEDHISTFTTVTAGRATPWAEFLAQKRHHAVSAFTGANMNIDFIYEHDRSAVGGVSDLAQEPQIIFQEES